MLNELLDFQETHRIVKVISGGQTGGDRAGLVAAKECGVATGGHAPFGYRTEVGTDMSLKTEFGLVEHSSPAYPPRTESNVKNSQLTIIFGEEDSAGCALTKKFCRKWHRPYFVVPSITPGKVEEIAKAIREMTTFDLTINVAGNREQKNPGVFEMTRTFMTQLIATVNT